MSKANISKRNWLGSSRLDSRILLKCLIAFNVILAVYNVLTLQSSFRSNKSTPCVVVINTSQGSSNDHNQSNDKKESALQSLPYQGPNDEMNTNSNNNNITIGSLSGKIDWQTERRANYLVIRNYIAADKTPNYNESVTLSTQGTFEFLHHVEPLCQRWDGPLSVAVYAPGDDLKLSMNIIYYLRLCKDECVRQNVSWHIVYDSAFGPPQDNISLPSLYLNKYTFSCSKTIEEITMNMNKTFRHDHSLPYPINVLRNVARLSSKTHYLLASDIELYPSVNVVSSFMDLFKREKQGLIPVLSNDIPHTYVLPIFEVRANVEPPFKKSQLRELIKSGDAIFFHKWVCDACQNFPNRDKWVQLESDDNTLNIFTVTKRLRNRSTWEPLYIGTNFEPLYDERLTWDGKRDKMSQMYEMCLKNYDLAILDNAFLVHAPGIKYINSKDERKRLPFIKRNNKVYDTIIAKLRRKYGSKNNC